MEQIDVGQKSTWLTRPLCRRYAVGSFSASTAEAGGRTLKIRWALGSLVNRESEVLGAWIDQDAPTSSLPALFRELHDRGAERIRWGLGDFDGFQAAAFYQTFKGAQVVESIEQTLEAVVARVSARHRLAMTCCLRAIADSDDLETARSKLGEIQGASLGERYPEVVQLWREALAGFVPIFSLNEQLRGLIRSTDQKAAEARGQLRRSISRHGPFTDAAAALEFVAVSLDRTEQRWDRERAMARAERTLWASRAAVRRSGSLGVMTLT